MAIDHTNHCDFPIYLHTRHFGQLTKRSWSKGPKVLERSNQQMQSAVRMKIDRVTSRQDDWREKDKEKRVFGRVKLRGAPQFHRVIDIRHGWITSRLKFKKQRKIYVWLATLGFESSSIRNVILAILSTKIQCKVLFMLVCKNSHYYHQTYILWWNIEQYKALTFFFASKHSPFVHFLTTLSLFLDWLLYLVRS